MPTPLAGTGLRGGFARTDPEAGVKVANVLAAPHVIGVDVGGTKILAGIIDEEGRIEHRRERETSVSSQEELIDELGAAAEELFDDSIAAVGFGLPSRLDSKTGYVYGSVNIPLRLPDGTLVTLQEDPRGWVLPALIAAADIGPVERHPSWLKRAAGARRHPALFAIPVALAALLLLWRGGPAW